ncbi:acetyltransferase [Clostridium acetobutylicum]|nr:acetyltransferase [Clostridium acetobutylicum]
MEEFQFINGDAELLELVKPLWEKLNEHHKCGSKYFYARYEKFKFEDRRKSFTNKDTKALNIDLIKRNDEYVGYCISTIKNKNLGEIESLFIEKECRGFGLGDKLMTRALKWLDKNGADNKIIGVAEGNEKVLEFYKRYGFYKRTVILQQVKN